MNTAASVHDLTLAHVLLHGEAERVYADSGCRGIEKREEHQERRVEWNIAMRSGKRKSLTDTPLDRTIERIEYLKASIRAKVEHPFRVIKRQFGFTKVRYRGLAKNDNNLHMLFALSNLYMSRHLLAT
ncbi:transposase [endosymbiont of Riftia pachyptila (vent Ph05)]|nr:transposase [endosymbiont of Riftia pachyptila (vent Ph05)]